MFLYVEVTMLQVKLHDINIGFPPVGDLETEYTNTNAETTTDISMG